MLLSVIIPTCNRNELLEKCLDCLSPELQEMDVYSYEIIVSDDGKENQAKELISEKYPWVTWVEGPKKGPAANRNNGAKYANGDWLVFLDDDVLPDASLLREYIKAINENPLSKAFEGAILPDDWDLLKKDMAECPINTAGGCFWSANICINKNLFWDIYGFDEQFLIAAQEDQDIFERVKINTVIVFLSKAFVIHPVRHVSLLNKIIKIPDSLKNWIVFFRKKNNFNKLIIYGFKYHFIAMITAIRKIHFKEIIYHTIVLIVYLPILLINYTNLNRSIK